MQRHRRPHRGKRAYGSRVEDSEAGDLGIGVSDFRLKLNGRPCFSGQRAWNVHVSSAVQIITVQGRLQLHQTILDLEYFGASNLAWQLTVCFLQDF